MDLTAVFLAVPAGYIGFVAELPVVTTRGHTLEEARTRLQQAVALISDSHSTLVGELMRGRMVSTETIALPTMQVAAVAVTSTRPVDTALLATWLATEGDSDADETLAEMVENG